MNRAFLEQAFRRILVFSNEQPGAQFFLISHLIYQQQRTEAFKAEGDRTLKELEAVLPKLLQP